ncbi:MAG TPA: MG2 domain-containing protein [Pyrinomonadaceae bacterium]|nr:MG2 domain-containing protein [Pyrinomonadaceae bacterium]
MKLKSLQPSSFLIYLVVIAAAFALAHSRVSSAANETPVNSPPVETVVTTKPFFSLSTNRTFGTAENPRMWVDYRGIDKLDFRVYRVNDPQRFFTQLSNPHQMGEYEQEQLTTTIQQKPSLLERLRAIKTWAYSGLRNYLRTQLNTETRRTFNHTFRPNEGRRTPLNVADYARVPLLNPNQLVTSWREPLPTDESVYDRRMIPLGKREPGVYLVEAVSEALRAYTIVVVTDLAMVEKSSPSGELLVYAVNRHTGEPQSDARVAIVKSRNTVATGTTNGEGIFRSRIQKPERAVDVDPEETAVDNDNFIVLASHRENFAISDLESYYFQRDEESNESVNGYIYTDRPIYRPAHKVYYKGILRAVDEQGQYRTPKSPNVTVVIKDPNDARVTEQEIRLSAQGTFAGELTLNEEAALGTYRVEAETDEGSSSGTFEVAEYKKPEYKVTVAAPQKFVAAGTKSKFNISARYFFGAPVANAEVKYYIYRSHYYPWRGYGEEEADEEDQDEYSDYGSYYGDMLSQGDGKLDASGQLSVDFDIPPSTESDNWDFEYRLEAQVTDSSRRTIDGSSTLIATRGNVIANAEPSQYVYRKGDTAKIAINTTDYEGRPVSSNVTLKFVVRSWIKVEKKVNEYDSDYKMEEKELSSAEIKTDQQGQANYNYSITGPGSIAIKTVVNDSGKQYVSIGGFIWAVSEDNQWADSYLHQYNGSIKLIPDKKSYRVGETARVLAILPQESANLLVTTELETVMSTQLVKATGRTVVIDVPIKAAYAPNVYMNVTFVHKGDMFTDSKRLVVPARDKMLNLEVIPNKSEYKPRETASYTILARNADGAPVRNAEVSLGVVDEAIYSISPDYSGSIRRHFYGTRYNSVMTHLSVAYSFIGYAGDKPMDLAKNKPSYQLADFKNQGDQVQPMIRKDFRDTAFWQPSVMTGADGRATVKFKLPDNLTTWRATARGVTSDTMVGVTTSKVIARKDVIMRLEIPRFITQGDTVTLSGVVHNYLKQAKATQISISVAGANLIGPAQQTVTIDQQGEHRVDWQISAPQTGQIQLLAKALTNTESDAVELTLDVVPRGLRETKVERWTTTDDAAEQQFTLEMPANADLNSRKLRIEAAPSIASTMFGALDYLTTYPYGCTEQTMSSFLPNIVVSHTLKEFKSASIRTSNDLKKKVERGRNRLYSFQHEDGGWGWWKDDASDPFMTAYVVDGLTLAKQAGYEIDDDRIVRGRDKLVAMLQAGKDDKDQQITAETRAFMVYALAETGGVDGTYVDKLYGERNSLQPYGRALLALTLSLQKDKRAWEIANDIERSVRKDERVAYWHTQREARLDFTEEDQTEGTALSLKALARIKPDSPLLPLVARWLVSDRTNSYFWNSTKDTAFAIYGLIDYVKVSRELAPAYDLEVYVNGENVLTERVTDANVARSFVIDRKGGAVGPSNHIRIVKRGKGSLYLSSAVEYYTGEEQVAARGSADLNLTREYHRLSVVEDGYKLKWTMSPLTGEIHSGDLIVVKLRLTGKKASHLMLEDPIPAGAEQLPAVGNMNLDYTDNDWSDWYSSREFRDRRTVFFLDSFDGDVTFQYAMRVQVPGDFVVAPARAELMYRPEINTNTSSLRFSFKDRVAKQ